MCDKCKDTGLVPAKSPGTWFYCDCYAEPPASPLPPEDAFDFACSESWRRYYHNETISHQDLTRVVKIHSNILKRLVDAYQQTGIDIDCVSDRLNNHLDKKDTNYLINNIIIEDDEKPNK